MSTTSGKPQNKYNKYVPNYDYSQVNNWSMNKKESNTILHEATKCSDAGDEEGYFATLKKLPLAPNIALMMRDDMGKEALLKGGYNLADAEIVYGKDWLDNYMMDE